MIELKESTSDGVSYLFRLGRRAYLRTTVLAWLLFSAFLLAATISTIISLRLLPTYAHTFTLYLKWQDALVALCCYIALTSLGACVLIGRFLYAARTGYHREMITVTDKVLIVRDLAPENLASIFWLVGTTLSCFLAALIGLLPEMLLGWTLHLSTPGLAVLATLGAILLSLGGLVITLPALSFVIIGLAGSISFCRNLGSPHHYQLSNQASLSIDGFVLTIIYPDTPESMVNLNMLDSNDQYHLLHLLRERWRGTQGSWNPQLGEEIEVALKEARRATVAVI